MNRKEDNNRPTIHIYYSSHNPEASDILKNFLWGMEEEGVPGITKEFDESNSVELAYKAALQSRLEVGIGIGRDGSVALHNTKLPPSEPLFLLNDIKNVAVLRSLGTNAARLVKGVPFKSLDPADNEEITIDKKSYVPNNIEHIDLHDDQVKDIVKEILDRLQKR